MFFQILGAIAKFEHALMSERTCDGLAAARTRGRDDGKRRHTVNQIASEFNVTRATIYRHVDERPTTSG